MMSIYQTVKVELNEVLGK